MGDLKKSVTQYVTRFNGIRSVSSENEELALSIFGDDLPEAI